SRQSRTPGFVWRVYRFVSNSVPRLPHRTFDGSAVPFSRDSGGGEPLGADHPVCGVRWALGLRAAGPGPHDGMAKADSITHAVLIAAPLVHAASGHFADQGRGDSAEPLQLRRAG